jgi:hypothetical protein
VSVSDVTLVGRESELSRLMHLFHLAQSGRTQIVLLHGRVGVGKTCLAQAVARYGAEHHGAVCVGTTPSYGEHLPFAGWDSVLLTLLDLDGVPQNARAEALMAALAKYELGVWAALIAIGGRHLTPYRKCIRCRGYARHAAQSTLRNCCASRAVASAFVDLDNVQWMTSVSLGLLDTLLTLPAQTDVFVHVYRDMGQG